MDFALIAWYPSICFYIYTLLHYWGLIYYPPTLKPWMAFTFFYPPSCVQRFFSCTVIVWDGTFFFYFTLETIEEMENKKRSASSIPKVKRMIAISLFCFDLYFFKVLNKFFTWGDWLRSSSDFFVSL